MGAGRGRARSRDAYPDVELIEFTGGDPPPGSRPTCSSAATSRWDEILRWIDAAGVRWVQLSGTGVDKVPRGDLRRPDRHVRTRRERGADLGVGDGRDARVGEAHAGDVRCTSRRSTGTSRSPRSTRSPGARSRSSVSAASAPRSRTRALAFDMRVRALRRTDAPSPVAGRRGRARRSTSSSPAPTTSCSPRRRPRRRAHLIDADVFAQVKPGVHLVNIARGALVDQDALRVALDDGRVAMATLDTVDPEPLPEGHWLYAHPKVRLTAHISWYTPDLQARRDRRSSSTTSGASRAASRCARSSTPTRGTRR